MANRSPSEGATLHYATSATASPTTWIPFLSVSGLPSPSSTRAELDGTALEDTASNFFLGKTDYGSNTINFFVESTSTTQYKAALAAQVAGTLWKWKITDPISTPGNTTKATHIWSAEIRELTTGRAVNGMLTGTMTLRARGAVAYTNEAA